MMTGNAGFGGDTLESPQRLRLRSIALRRGFAAAVTNSGHDARDEPLATFAQNRQKLLDYAFRSLQVTAEAGKRITEAYYGAKPSRSYFQGCSTGGRQALIIAQRFPQIFDGIVAGAPVLNFSRTMAAFAYREQVLSQQPVPYAKLKTLAERIYAQCDDKDGLKDGLIDDPRRCDFRPSDHLPLCASEADDVRCFTATGDRNSPKDLWRYSCGWSAFLSRVARWSRNRGRRWSKRLGSVDRQAVGRKDNRIPLR